MLCSGYVKSRQDSGAGGSSSSLPGVSLRLRSAHGCAYPRDPVFLRARRGAALRSRRRTAQHHPAVAEPADQPARAAAGRQALRSEPAQGRADRLRPRAAAARPARAGRPRSAARWGRSIRRDRRCAGAASRRGRGRRRHPDDGGDRRHDAGDPPGAHRDAPAGILRCRRRARRRARRRRLRPVADASASPGARRTAMAGGARARRARRSSVRRTRDDLDPRDRRRDVRLGGERSSRRRELVARGPAPRRYAAQARTRPPTASRVCSSSSPQARV